MLRKEQRRVSDVLLSGAARYSKIHHDIIEHHGTFFFQIQLLRNSNLHFFSGMNSALMLETLKCVGPSLRYFFPGQKSHQLSLEEHQPLADNCCLWKWVRPRLLQEMETKSKERLDEMWEGGFPGCMLLLASFGGKKGGKPLTF
jgi:hypothetical protein